MDCMAAFHSPESLLVDLGLRGKGDVFSLKAFCRRRLGKTSDESPQKGDIEEKKRRLVEQLREEKEKKKRGAALHIELQRRVKRNRHQKKRRKKAKVLSCSNWLVTLQLQRLALCGSVHV